MVSVFLPLLLHSDDQATSCMETPNTCHVWEVDINQVAVSTQRYIAQGDGKQWVRARRGNNTGLQRLLQAPRALITTLSVGLQSTFLPVGYPQSVRAEYLTYQAYDTLQALCSYLRGILTTKAILEGSGVGSAEASALSAAVNWVFRDGIAMTCSLCFSSLAATSFDGCVKEWRLFADIVNDLGLTLDMLTSIFPSKFLLLTCLGTICKTMCGVAAACTKSSITAHFATTNNVADVAAKESAQETAVTLCGILGGLMFARAIAHPMAIWPVFGFLTLLHVYANHKAVRALALCTINTQRATILIEDTLTQKTAEGVSRRSWRPRLLTPKEVAVRERVWRPLVHWFMQYHPAMGVPLPEVCPSPQEYLYLAGSLCNKEQYLFNIGRDGQIRIGLRARAGPEDELKAFYQALMLRHLYAEFASEARCAKTRSVKDWPPAELKTMLVDSYQRTVRDYPKFLQQLKEQSGDAAWDLRRVLLGSRSWRLEVESEAQPNKKDR